MSDQRRFISRIMLQRIFFRHFFGALHRKGIIMLPHARGADVVDICFGKALDVLRLAHNKDPDLDRLTHEIGRDPLTGSSRALWDNLIHVFPGGICDRYVRISECKIPSEDWLPQDLVDRAAQAFAENYRNESFDI